MKRITKTTFPRLLGAWVLILALLLSGCTFGQTSANSDTGADDANVSDDAGTTDTADTTEEEADADQPVDYSKYNAYLEVLNSVYEMDDLLTGYFTVVQYQPEFALVDGAEYSMLDDVFGYYTFHSYIMTDALSYCDEDPAYPEQDELLKQLDEPFQTMGEILSDLGWYISYQQYDGDNLAEAAELHTRLYEAVGAFDEAALPFMESMNALDEATEADELERLQAEGWDIAYYTRIIVSISNDIDTEIWEQLSAVETGTLPPLDMTNLETLYTEHQEAYASLTEALADPESVQLVWPDSVTAEVEVELFTDAASNVNTALENFMTATRNQEDYSESYDAYFSACSRLIDLYNSMISG
ncbi:DUF3829 domain-containing protein [Candidatus Avoscillospira sp. LCP25S3_F1]|uniref:DUF3829 domain-containing protein n=1 Tax=Candidatus Avoscillospira sp. LCP25S3_F1 TaxID=3438825 RepID=UPI003F9016D2